MNQHERRLCGRETGIYEKTTFASTMKDHRTNHEHKKCYVLSSDVSSHVSFFSHVHALFSFYVTRLLVFNILCSILDLRECLFIEAKLWGVRCQFHTCMWNIKLKGPQFIWREVEILGLVGF